MYISVGVNLRKFKIPEIPTFRGDYSLRGYFTGLGKKLSIMRAGKSRANSGEKNREFRTPEKAGILEIYI